MAIRAFLSGRGTEYSGVLFLIRKPRGWCETRDFTVFAILTAYSARAKGLAAGTMGCEYGV
jgi:hypothetical protein